MADCRRQHITEIENIAADKRFGNGDVIFYDGDEGVGFYLVAAGSVKVYKLSPEGKEQILHIVKEGETIGAVPVFSGQSFPANACAISPCSLLNRAWLTELAEKGKVFR